MARTAVAGLSAAVQEPAGTKATPEAKLLDLAGIALDLCIGGLTVAYAKEDKEHWYGPAIGDLVLGALKAVAF